MRENDVTIVVGSDEQPAVSVSKAADAQDANDTPDVADPADDGAEVEPQYAVPPPLPRPQLDDKKEDGSDRYDTYEDFLAAHGEWVMQEGARRLEEQQAIRRQVETVNARHAAAADAYRQENPDFDAAMKSAKPVVAKLKKELGRGVLNIVDKYTISDADNGVAVIHHLASHPDELRRIVRLPPALQLAELGKLDAAVGSASSRRPAPTATARKLRDVGIENAYGSDDFQEYKRQREADERARRR